MKKIMILGANGFIGHHLCQRILQETNWEIVALDLMHNRLDHLLDHPRMQFRCGNLSAEEAWLQQTLPQCDVVLPLAAISTPASYVDDPLAVFSLNFEAQLPVIRLCAQHGKRLIFPSTSEVYGMCPDREFDPERSPLVYGPTDKSRWIYASSKQLLDRLIHAHGERDGLDYTIFRPFNWIGPGQDDDGLRSGKTARVVPQFLGNLRRGEPIHLVDGGAQRRTFTAIDDGISALLLIIANHEQRASRKTFNLGNPGNDFSVRELAEKMLVLAQQFPLLRETASRSKLLETSGALFYGEGYQDLPHRVPDISHARDLLGWTPRSSMDDILLQIFTVHCQQACLPTGC